MLSYLRERGVLGSFDHAEICQWQWIRRDAWPLLPDVLRDHLGTQGAGNGVAQGVSSLIFELSLACVKAA